MKSLLFSDIHKEVNGNKKVYTGIDVCKLICAILVVLLHAIENNSWSSNGIKFIFTRFAVPFFFISSGYFFNKHFSVASDKKKYFIAYEKKILKSYFVWAVIIYLPFEIYSYTRKYAGVNRIYILLIMLRRYLLIGPGPYWYLLALAVSIAVIYYCSINSKEYLLRLLIAAGLLIEILYTGFRSEVSQLFVFNLLFDTIYILFSWEFNFLMFGIPFVGIGFLIYRYDVHCDRMTAVASFIFATICRVLEYIFPFLNKGMDGEQISIAFIAQAIFLFIIAKDCDIQIQKSGSIVVRQLSSTVYYVHAIILYELLNPLLIRFTELPVYADWMIIPKVILCVCGSLLFYLIIKSINNEKLNILING